jgi:hypothetical protein
MRVWIAILISGLLFSVKAVDFKKDIQPLLKNKCSRCHSGHEAKGGFSINMRTTLLEAAKPGDSAGSLLLERITSSDPDERMPSESKPLTAKEIALIKAWIDEGIAWPKGYNFAEWHKAPLAPRAVKLPPGKGNPIDRLLAGYFKQHKINASQRVSDRVFARRVWLDLIGLLPPVDELEEFVADKSPAKRAALIDRLLADKRAYADHWMTFWNDHLRNAYFGPGFIDNGRAQITTWLYRALHANMPYDQFVRELISGINGAGGFVKGIKWRGAVNASQRREMQAAQNLGQIFLGTNLKCASCHNSFVNYWKLEDSYSLAAIFAEGSFELHRCDKPTGKNAKMKFLFPELGSIDPKAPTAARQQQLAKLMTSEKNGRLRRVIVNRLWARLLGHGLSEPLDDIDQPAWHPDLLDWLATDLAANGHDLKHTLKLICTSRAYQLPAAEPMAKNFTFRGPAPKRLHAEQFVDALSTLSGQWQNGAPFLKLDGRKQGGQVGAVSTVLAAKNLTEIRAVLSRLDPLQRALGRPNRDQVVTTRDSLPTLLQALELTNGTTLDNYLKHAATHWLKKSPDAGAMISKIYQTALSRKPTKTERAIALETLGKKPTPETTADLLWIFVMLPEFQLIQ